MGVQLLSDYVMPLLAQAMKGIEPLAQRIDHSFEKKRPLEIIAITIFACVATHYIKGRLYHKNWRKTGIDLLRMIPSVAQKIEQKRDKFRKELEHSTYSKDQKPIHRELPKTGLSEGEIFKIEEEEKIWEEGKVSGAVYHNRQRINKITLRALEQSLHSNPMHVDLFRRERQMKAEIISMIKNLFHGDASSCGTVTSGGTESLLLACLAARNRGEKDYEIVEPEIIIPVTAHAAFLKAGAYFKIKMVLIPVDPDTLEVDVEKVKKAINKNTVMVVGSCPQFPHGIIDPIQDLSDAILPYEGRIGLHVDCCLGFLAPFMVKAGFEMPAFDFRVWGVTSISVDTHKYGLGIKSGGSVLMYRNEKWMNHQFFVATQWPGCIYTTPNIPGSHAGALVAATHAVILSMGEEGYVNLTKNVIAKARELAKALGAIPEIAVMGDPQMSVVAFQSKNEKLDIYALSDKLKGKKWHLNEVQRPAGIHFCITDIQASDEQFVDKFIEDLKDCIAKILKNPSKEKSETAALYGEMQKIPVEFAEEFAHIYWDVNLGLGTVT